MDAKEWSSWSDEADCRSASSNAAAWTDKRAPKGAAHARGTTEIAFREMAREPLQKKKSSNKSRGLIFRAGFTRLSNRTLLVMERSNSSVLGGGGSGIGKDYIGGW
jgi:transcriptional regulator with GAF, ATPase, and Fis domain